MMKEIATVLLVDDEPSLRWTMAEFLKRAEYNVLTASDFDEALEALNNANIDVAVVDIFLPHQSGLELLRQIQARVPSVPVIMMTGDPDASHIPELIRAGAHDFLPKPVTKDVLLTAVSRGVEKKRLVDAKSRLEREIQSHAEHLEASIAARTAELAEAHNFLNAVLDSSTEYAIVAIDMESRITLFNRGAETMFGYTADQVLTEPAGVLVAVDDDGSSVEQLKRRGLEAQEAGRSQVEIELGRADASSFVASLVMTPIASKSDAGLLGYLCIIKDLTSERQSENALRQMRARLAHNEKIAALGQVAAQVAHEIKNPLAGLSLYAGHLKNKVADKLAQNELILIDKIIETINSLSNNADQILNFARPVTLTLRPIDLNRVLTDIIQLLEPQISSNKVSVALHLTESSATCALDEAPIRSALLNLALNAIQAMPNGGELTVKTEARLGKLAVRITDTGSGMTKEQLKNVFEPFYTTKSHGLGLGMSYAQKIIEQHQGEIKLESCQNQGTMIEVELPAELKAEAITAKLTS
jgi:PAS domain S-box-containing protein